MPSPRRAPRVPRAEREASLLREAGAVFATRGYHAASMDEIAERVGVSKPVVYSYFGSKESLYFAYIEEAGATLLERMIAADAEVRDGSPADRLHSGAVAFFAFVDEFRDGYTVLFGELAARGAPFRREVSAIRRRIVGLTQAVLHDVAGGEPHDLEALALAFVGAGESLANWWLEHPEETVDDIAGRLMNVAWLGLDAVLHGRAAPWATTE